MLFILTTREHDFPQLVFLFLFLFFILFIYFLADRKIGLLNVWRPGSAHRGVPTLSLLPSLHVFSVTLSFWSFSPRTHHLTHDIWLFLAVTAAPFVQSCFRLDNRTVHFFPLCIHIELFPWHRAARRCLAQPVTMWLIGEIILVKQ